MKGVNRVKKTSKPATSEVSKMTVMSIQI